MNTVVQAAVADCIAFVDREFGGIGGLIARMDWVIGICEGCVYSNCPHKADVVYEMRRAKNVFIELESRLIVVRSHRILLGEGCNQRAATMLRHAIETARHRQEPGVGQWGDKFIQLAGHMETISALTLRRLAHAKGQLN